MTGENRDTTFAEILGPSLHNLLRPFLHAASSCQTVHKAADLAILSKTLIEIRQEKPSGRFGQSIGQGLAGICEKRIFSRITSQ